MTQNPTNAGRRNFVVRSAATVAAISAPGFSMRAANAAEFSFKLATTIPPEHPLNAHAKEAATAIAEQTGGRVQIDVFPGYVLGSSTSALSQVRGGGIHMITIAGSILSTLVPLASIYNTAFAFKNSDQVFQATDGKLGEFVRNKIDKVGLRVVGKHWDLGFRHITTSDKVIRSPADLANTKLRVPVSPLFVSCFTALGAVPTPINFDELYSALQTKLIDGQENDVIVTSTAKLYEVQKHCALTGHIWEGYFTLANDQIWKRLPANLQEIVQRNFAASAIKERAAVQALTASTKAQLQQKGMSFNEVDREAFQKVLRNAGFYSQWKEKFGPEAWALLEAVTGPLA